MFWRRCEIRPTFAFDMHSLPGEYHGFLWFFFINEQLLRFLNLRYPRDYDTVPRVYFWLFHLMWLFPWSVYLPAVAKLSYQALGSRRPGAPAGAVLDWLRAGLFHLLHHAGVLLDALLSRVRAVAGLGDGRRRRLGATRNAGAIGDCGARGAGVRDHPVPGARSTHAGRHLHRALPPIPPPTSSRWGTCRT